MILQTIEEPTGIGIIFNILALMTTITIIALFFGTLLYLFTFVYRFKDKTEASERFFWFRSFAIAIIAALIVYGVEYMFSIILFSPLFYAEIPVDLLNSVMSTDIKGIISALVDSPIQVVLLFIVMIALIVAILSYVMLGIYKVNYGWTTIVTMSAIAIFILVDISVSILVNEGGLSGIIGGIGDSIRGLAPS